ncbi:MAG: GNAT family N-acetyltransferase [Hyphomicrobiales bacterium]|nr:MAG: GNAT family N-acetyltransferase [Hyphomicrobiales bacterium]
MVFGLLGKRVGGLGADGARSWSSSMWQLMLQRRGVLHVPGVKNFIKNLCSMGGAQIAIRLSRVLTTVLLARILTPLDFGLAAIVVTVYELVSLCTRNGISAKVVQANADEADAVAHTALTLTWIVCGSLLAFQTVIAVLIGYVRGDAQIALAIGLMGLIYLATPLSSMQAAFMQRDGRLGRIAITSAVQVITDNILSAGLALLGFGMWAIILPKLLVAPIWVIGLRTGHAWRPRSDWSLTGWREIAQFSRSVLGVEFLTTLQSNIDYLIVGTVLGVEALGVYYFAFNAGLGITLGLLNSFATAVYAYLCEVRSDQRALKWRYHTSALIVGIAIVPLVLLQTSLAPIYVPIVFGAKWEPAIPVLMLICLSALPRPFAVVGTQFLRAVGRPDLELRWQGALTCLLVVGMLVGSNFGIVGVAAAVLSVQGVVLSAYALIAPRLVLKAQTATLPREERLDFSLVTNLSELQALEPEWKALWAQAHEPYLSQSYAWCLTGWLTTAQLRQRKLCVVVGRHNERVVLIWPMALRRRGPIWEAIGLGSESTEYNALLVSTEIDERAAVAHALRFVRHNVGCDIATVPFARHDAAGFAALASGRWGRRTHQLPAPFVRFSTEGWDAYWKSRSANLRAGLARRRRRLAERGRIVSRWIEDDAEFAKLVDWSLAHKTAWMKRHNLENDFLQTAEYRRFLLAMRSQRQAGIGLVMFALFVDDTPVAVKIGCLDGTRYEGFITTYDEAWSAFSPGQIILADCLAYCCAQGLIYDFRIGEESYKKPWATDFTPASRISLATGPRGAVMLAAMCGADVVDRLICLLRQSIPKAWKRRFQRVADYASFARVTTARRA